MKYSKTILSDRINFQLIQIITNKDKFSDAKVEVAIRELKRRGFCKSEANYYTIEDYLPEIYEKIIGAKVLQKKNREFNLLKNTSLYPILAISFLLFLILTLTRFKLISIFQNTFLSHTFLITVFTLACLTYNEVKNGPSYKKWNIIQIRSILSILYGANFFYYGIIQNDFSYGFLGFTFYFPLVFLYSYFLTLPFKHIKYKGKDFPGYIKSISQFILFAIIGVHILFYINHRDSFIKKQSIEWLENIPVESFRGYPKLLSSFDAGILSYIYAKVEDMAEGKVSVNAFCETSRTWIRKKYQDNKDLLTHEQYHFNISEIHARILKKEITETSILEFSLDYLNNLVSKRKLDLDEMQGLYDRQTSHSTDIEQQKIWEYVIDSTLNELEYYSGKTAFFHKTYDEGYQHTHFRKLDIDYKGNFIGYYPFDSLLSGNSKYYQLEHEEGEIKRISHYNYGRLSYDNVLEAAVVDIIYKDGYKDIIYKNEQGNPRPLSEGPPIIRKILSSDKKKLIYLHLNENGKEIQDHQAIAKVEYDLDEGGYFKYRRKYSVLGNQVMDEYGDFTILYVFDNQHKTIKQINLNHTGHLLEDIYGIATYEYQKDDNSNITYIANYRKTGEVWKDEDGVSIKQFTYDSWGNKKEELNLDADQQLLEDKNGIAKTSFTHNKNGKITRESYHNQSLRLADNNNGVATKYFKYDNHGKLVEESSYGIAKNLKFDNNQWGVIRYKYDSLNRISELSNFDAYDNFLNTSAGYYRKQYVYNEKGNIQEEIYLDIKGRKFSTESGVHKVTFKYDIRDNTTEIAHYDSLGGLIEETEDVAVFRYGYDERGNKIKTSYWNKDMERADAAQRISINTYKYDHKNRMVERSYLDKNENLAPFDNRCKIKITYDESDNEIEVLYFDKDNELIKGSDNLAIIKNKYDLKNQLIEEQFYNAQQNLINGRAIIKYDFDKKGNIIKEAYLNKLKKSFPNENGIALITYSYTTNNLLHEKKFYDEYDHLKANNDGVAIYKYHYNDCKKIAKEEFLDSDGQSVKEGIARIEYTYDNACRLKSKTYYDHEGKKTKNNNSYLSETYYYNLNSKIVRKELEE